MAKTGKSDSPRAILLVSCPDARGLVARISNFVYANNGNIVDSDHHTDKTVGRFLCRFEWELDGFAIPREALQVSCGALAREIGADWRLAFSDVVPRVALFVTKQSHCLHDLLWRQEAGELRAEIPLVISNHDRLRSVVERCGIEYRHVPVTADTKAAAEARQLELIRAHRVDMVVLAKYMQVLSEGLLRELPDVINIHHSFLPAFQGARPYHRAHERGVKIIGATAHFVTPELDEGPIIEQGVERVSHRETVRDLIRRGRDIERRVLARAVWMHLEHRVMVYGNRTVVFG